MNSEPRQSWNPGFSTRDGAQFVLIVLFVWLGWEIVRSALVVRGPPALAVSLAPASPEALGRLAEAELIEDRVEQAKRAADDSLARAPFNVRALRVRGLVEARLGRKDTADEMLTLAGNWSLRDDPTHAWLTVNRLERGDYVSAFAHADTLARRRSDTHPSVFGLFTVAATEDARALPVITRMVAGNPPWRSAYIDYLLETDYGAEVIGVLALSLRDTRAPFNADELEQLYNSWLRQRRFEGVRTLREQLLPSNADAFLQNGNFSTGVDDQLQPFGWAMGFGPGIVSTITGEDSRPRNQALFLQYDGFATGVLARQLLILQPGPYVLTGSWRAEVAREALPFGWQVICLETGRVASTDGKRLSTDTTDWRRLTYRFTVPREDCSLQWLQIAALPSDRRATSTVWFDDLRVQPVSPAVSPAEIVDAR